VEAQIDNQKRFGWSEVETEESLQGLLDQTDYHIHILDGDGSEIYGPGAAVADASNIPDAVISEVASESGMESTTIHVAIRSNQFNNRG